MIDLSARTTRTSAATAPSPSDPNALDGADRPGARGAAIDAARRIWAAIGIIRAEWRMRRTVNVSLSQRLACLRQGFNSRSLIAYGAALPPEPGLYVSDWHEAALSKRPNRAYSLVLDDKLAFWLTMRHLTPHLAPLSGILWQRRFHPLEGGGRTCSVDELVTGATESRVFKPVRGTLGRGIFILDPVPDGLRVNGKPGSAAEVLPSLHAGSYVVAPRIEQAGYSRAIFPAAVNSIRVVTLIDPDTSLPFIPFAVHRFGVNRTAPLDAFGTGGIVAAVDVATGQLGPAISAAPGRGRTVSDTHPDTGVQIAGVQVPRWREICDHLLTLAARVAFLPYVGWDVIVTDNDFLINEGNSRPSLRLLQACGPILTDERVRRFYQFHGVVRA